jgi:cobalt-precorrin 5A hydrolase
MSSVRKPWAVYGITKHGAEAAAKLAASLPGADLYLSTKVKGFVKREALDLSLPMGPVLHKTFQAYDCHIFIISVGAVIRMIAPLLENKKADPAVICIDDNAQYVIPILSGHVGRGNEFARRTAAVLNAQPVITTASDVRGTLTVDILGRELGWVLDDMDRNVTKGCAAVVNQRPVLIVQETGETDFWPRDQPMPEGVHYTTSFGGIVDGVYEIILAITDRDFRERYPAIYENAVIYRPKSLVLGLGCDSQTPLPLIERGIHRTLASHHLDIRCVKAFASVQQKAQEPAFLALQEKYGWHFRIFPAEELDALQNIPNPSLTVKKFVGTRGVAEPSALLAAGAARLLIPKQIYKESEIPRSMTIAVARIPFPARTRESQTVMV